MSKVIPFKYPHLIGILHDVRLIHSPKYFLKSLHKRQTRNVVILDSNANYHRLESVCDPQMPDRLVAINVLHPIVLLVY